MSFFQDLILTHGVSDPIEMLCDNTIAIQYVKDLKFHWKTKHIKRRYHFVRDTIKTKDIAIIYIPTNKMVVDILIKPIPRYALKVHMLSLGPYGV